MESLASIIHASLAHTSTIPEQPQLDIASTDQEPNHVPEENELQPAEDSRTSTAEDSARTEGDLNKSTTLKRQLPPQSMDGHKLSKHELQVDAMQVKMLEALTELSKNNHNDVKDKTLTAVDTLLQSSGQTLNSG